MIARRAVALSLLIAPLLGRSVHAESDVGLWLAASLDKKLGKRFDVSLEEEVRFDHDISRLEEFFTEASVTYRPHKLLRADLGLRVGYERNKAGVLERRLLGFAALRPRVRAGPIEISYRGRFQRESRGAFADDDWRNTLRNRITIALVKTDPWVPAVAAETFHRLGDGETIQFQKLRLTAGIERGLGDHEVEVYYRLEVLQNDPEDPTLHIIGIAYHYEL